MVSFVIPKVLPGAAPASFLVMLNQQISPTCALNSLITAKYTQESTNLHHVQIFLC